MPGCALRAFFFSPLLPCRLVLACICIGILLLFLGLWVYFIALAYRRVQLLNYSEHRLANISIRIQARRTLAVLTSQPTSQTACWTLSRR